MQEELEALQPQLKIAVKEKTNVQRTVQKQGIAEFTNLVFKACNELNL